MARNPTVSPGKIKVTLFAVVLLSLGAIVAVALIRESKAPTPAQGARTSPLAPRPALTPAEDAYARALWSIHGEVKASAFQMAIGGISYKIGEIDRATLRKRVQAAGHVYRRAESRARDLTPPPSFRALHAEYLEAVHLYEQSAGEMARVSEDGKEEHLVTAFPMSLEAGKKLLRVGDALWPGEYVPN